MLVRHLPPDSATVRAVTGQTEPQWTRTDHLLAAVFDALQVLSWQFGNQGRKSPTPRPRPLPRPGMEDKSRKVKGTPMPLAELRKVLPGIEKAPSDAG